MARLGTWSWKEGAAEVDADERAREIGGLPVTGPVTFADALSRIHPDDRPRVRAALANAFDAGSLYVEEFRIAHDDGALRWVVARGRVVAASDATGGTRLMVGSLLDITEQRRAEEREAARVRDARMLAAIVATSDDAIVSKSLDGRIQSWNAAAERLFGYTAEQAIGRQITLIIPPERIAEEDQIIASLKAGLRVEHFETERCRSDGTRILVSLTVSPLIDDQGNVSNQPIRVVVVDTGPVTVDLNGDSPQIDFTTSWNNTGAVLLADVDATVTNEPGMLTSMAAVLHLDVPGDVLTVDTAGTQISAGSSTGCSMSKRRSSCRSTSVRQASSTTRSWPAGSHTVVRCGR